MIEDFVNTLRNMTNLIIHLKLYDDKTYLMLLNGSPLNLSIDSVEIAKIMGEVNSNTLDSMNVLVDKIYQIYKCRVEHNTNDWEALNDAVHSVTNEYFTENELETLIVGVIPKKLRDESYSKGMDATSWLDEFKLWATANLEIKENL